MSTQDVFYTCDYCTKVIHGDRYHYRETYDGDSDYDVCTACFPQMTLGQQHQFVLIVDSTPLQGIEEATETTTVASPEEDYDQAHHGIDFDDERSMDSQSTGSLDDFALEDEDPFVFQEEEMVEMEAFPAIGETMVMDLDDFQLDLEEPKEPKEPNCVFTTMVGDEDWEEQSDDEADDDSLDDKLDDNILDFHNQNPATPLIVRGPRPRPFGKRVIRPVIRFGYEDTHVPAYVKDHAHNTESE